MSIEAIAARASVGKKTIYRWWPSKEALVIDAIKNLQQTSNPVIATASLREDFIAMSKNAFQSWSGPSARELAINLLGVMVNHPNVYQAFYDQIIAPRFQQFRQVIKLAQARGEIRQDINADEIIGLLAGPVWYHLFFGTESNPLVQGLPERLVDAILRGIAMPGKPREIET